MKAYVEMDLPEYYDLDNEIVELLRVTVSNGAIADTFRPYAILKKNPTGKWIVSDNGKYQTCSECGIEMFHSDWSFCPNCGAYMGG